MPFVQALLDHTKDYESPTSFWKWAAYAAIAGVLRDNVWLADGDSRLYPNVYILFLAGSAQRKGRPITFAEQLVVHSNNVKVISGRASIQSIMVEVGMTETDSTTGKIIKGGSAIFFAPELAAGLVQDEQAIQILTDIYDHKPTGHSTSLISRSKSKLDRLIFSMFAASNEDLLKSVYDQRAVYGGLLGRTFLIKSNEERPPNAFPVSNEEGFKRLKDFITEISRLSGEMTFMVDARLEYKTWYDDFYKKMKKANDRAGILGRLPTSAKKLAILLAANDLSAQVCLCHVQQSIDECLALIPNYNSFAYAGGESSIAKAGAIILEAFAHGPVNKRSLICENWMHFDSETLDKAIAAFESGGLVKMQIVTNDAWYTLTPKGEEIIGKPQGKSTTT